MKPREFDDLIRQKFDQDDFAYNPNNWDSLAKELDGRAKKRNLMIWWMPLVGMAASVAFAIGISTVIRNGGSANTTVTTEVAKAEFNTMTISSQPDAVATSPVLATTAHISQRRQASSVTKDISNWFALRMENAVSNVKSTKPARRNIDLADAALLSQPFVNEEEQANKKKITIDKPGMHTFKETAMAKPATKTAILISGGVSYGSQSSGYTVGASARHMVNDKLYVEGDVAFIGTSNSQQTEYMEMPTTQTHSVATTARTAAAASRDMSASKISGADAKTTSAILNQGVLKNGTETYNLYYAQVTPSLGYKLLKRMSIGVGPDFQQMLVDNRPAPSELDHNTLKEVPSFDIGFMGKTEYAVTRNIKAAIYYREGVNNIITPTGKYIDRNYVQFQVKCAIFNK